MGDGRESGAAATEYGLLLAAVAVLIVVLMFAFGTLTAGTLKRTGDSVAAQSGAHGVRLETVVTAPTVATTVTEGHRCGRHGASASTTSGVHVRCMPGPGGVYRWRVA
jgi:Flp pilus assembly pilin Flp